MAGFSIAVIIVGLLVFAELYSIREILNRQQDRSDYVQTIQSKLKSLQIDLNEQSEALNELIEMIEDNKTLLSPRDVEILNHSKYVAIKTKSQTYE